ncbi:tetratricopeptide repeat protein [Novosphingobium huizhouense]|uniref:tetratricopeptide repeat protein n=1 Tax=Novosphingobium huizhouense TaxID=2866625 RepID=UPI001CD83650|nr:hypothetical protein [Novosphingobium huizhouense]
MLFPLPLLAALATPFPVDAPVARQVGPNPSPQQASPLPIPRRRRVEEMAPGAAPETKQDMPDRLAACLATGRQDLIAGLASARLWRDGAPTDFERTRANQCLGLLLAESGDYAGAEAAFAAAIAAIPPEQAASSLQLLAMAGNAALAAGHADRATGWFDRALALKDTGDNAARGDIEIDRARALVAGGRIAEAGGALDEAHRLAPEDPEGWLLSATLARRGGDLDRAQRDIEVAAAKDPRDPAIGLEAGVIAVLAGRDEAARKSWDSVVRSAPQSAEAATARGYLEQLGAAPTSNAAATQGKATP